MCGFAHHTDLKHVSEIKEKDRERKWILREEMWNVEHIVKVIDLH